MGHQEKKVLDTAYHEGGKIQVIVTVDSRNLDVVWTFGN